MNEHASAAAWFSPILKGNALVIMQALAYLADDFDGQVTVKIEKLCTMTRLTRRTVQKALRELETLTFIERLTRGTGGQGVATEYRVRTSAVLRGTNEPDRPMTKPKFGKAITPETLAAIRGARA